LVLFVSFSGGGKEIRRSPPPPPPCPQQTEKPFRNPKEAMAQFESQICDE
jgi:hypothetical protein